ncbi:MAG: hypothetical protein ACK526_13530 [Planctomyces sp.]
MTTQTLVATSTRFPIGDVVITINAQSLLTPDEAMSGLQRHATGDWGELCTEDAERNLAALESGGRIFSAYGKDTRRFWIITEADRSSTTILLPLDY